MIPNDDSATVAASDEVGLESEEVEQRIGTPIRNQPSIPQLGLSTSRKRGVS